MKSIALGFAIACVSLPSLAQQPAAPSDAIASLVSRIQADWNAAQTAQGHVLATLNEVLAKLKALEDENAKLKAVKPTEKKPEGK